MHNPLVSLALCFSLLALTCTPASAGPAPAAPTAPTASRRVCPTCTYTSVQAAVDAADPGDLIEVATGVYSGVNDHGGLAQVLYVTRTLTIRGGYSPDFSAWDPDLYPTTLNAGGLGRVIYVAGPVSPTLEYLRITGGDATDLGGAPYGGYDAGGGVYVDGSPLRLQHNRIYDNVANTAFNGGLGGGVYLYESDALVLDNTISGNDGTLDTWSDGSGGGLYAEGGAPLIQGNRVLDNQAGAGGFFGFGDGGGLYFANARPTVEANQIRNNRAVGAGDWGTGGGVVIGACQGFTLTNNVIADNSASYSGSEIYLQHISGVPSYGWFVHNTIARRQGLAGIEGVRVTGAGTLVTFTNTILAGHETGINVSFETTATLTATLWDNGTDWGDVGGIFTGTVNLWGDPGFINPGGGDYHIAAASPARDAGVQAGVGSDVDGEPRDAEPDLGADEVVEGGSAQLQVDKAASAALLYAGDRLTYTVSVHSAGTLDVTHVVLTDTFPALQRPLGVTSDRGSCSVSDPGYGGRVGCSLGQLAAGQSAHVTITAQVTTTLPPGAPHAMRNEVLAAGDQAQGSAYADTLLDAPPNCRARVDGALPTYTSVQAAVDAAGAGSTVWIAGTCRGASQRAGLFQQVYLTRSLTLRGGYSLDFAAWDPAAYPTTLHAEGEGRAVYAQGAISVTLEHLRLTGGDATGLGGDPNGYGDAGGGLYALGATLVLSNCQVTGNVASRAAFGDGYGGGAAVFTGTLRAADSVWTGNTAAADDWGNGYGGALFAEGSSVRLERNGVQENAASGGLVGTGGGAAVFRSDLQAEATLWLSNTVSALGLGFGGGLYVGGEAPFALSNCVWVGNRAGDGFGNGGSALHVEGASGTLLHPTLARNRDGVALSAAYTASVAITNAIVFSHSLGIQAEEASFVSIDGVLWHANVSDTVAITATIQISHACSGDPAFAADGYHLTGASRALDRGVAGAAAGVDLDGEARPSGAGHDLGADEFIHADSLTVHGPAAGYTGRAYSFAATAGPPTATLPLTYTWQATGLSPLVHGGGGITDTAALLWPTAGSKTVIVSVQNGPLVVSDTRTIEIVECVALAGVALAGPSTVTLGLPAAFTAAASPANATQPITYTWTASGQPPQIRPGGALSDSMAFTWTAAGPRTVVVSAANACGAAVSRTHTLDVLNAAPVADAGPDQSVNAGERVALDGSGSYDPDGHTLLYAWRQTGGTPVTLSAGDSASPTFTAPANTGVLTFTLVVTDSFGLASPAPDLTTVSVRPADRLIYLPLVTRTSGGGGALRDALWSRPGLRGR